MRTGDEGFLWVEGLTSLSPTSASKADDQSAASDLESVWD
jgi:hypothetical protein